MRALDASSWIYGWDNYPIDQFPPVWRWIEGEIGAGRLTVCDVALVEVNGKAPDCGAWLRDVGIRVHAVDGAILAEAMRIKALLGIANDNFHPKGVGENDILIVAAARVLNCPLTSDEAVQMALPNETRRYKIPAVCNLPSVAVPCGNFLALLKDSGQRFG